MRKVFKLIIILALLLLLTSCWDKVEINERFFISAIGIDLYKGEEHTLDAAERNAEENEITQTDRFIVTFVAPNLKAMGKNPTSDKPRIVMASISNNIYETTKELAARTNRTIFFKHTKVFLIGEEVARNKEYMKEIFDNLARHEQISRKLNVLISKESAKDIIDIEDPFEPVTGQLISGILNKSQGSARYNPLVLEDILLELRFDGNALIPRAIPGKGEVKIAGSAVIKDFECIGWIGEIENITIMFLIDKIETALINISNDDVLIPYIITSSKTKQKVTVVDNKIIFNVNIATEGYVQQYKLNTKDELSDEETIKEIEKRLDETLTKQILATAHKLQKEFKVDVIGVGQYISKFEPDLWDEVKDNWVDIFPNIDITVNVDAKLRRIGMTK